MHCDLANVDAVRTRATRVVADGSRLTGATLTESVLRDVTLRGCRVDLATFGFAGLERVTFEDCLLAGTSFVEARMRDVRFHGCDLSGADFRGARMTTCELRGCTLTELAGIEGLRGPAMEWSDVLSLAPALAAALGIEILE